MLSNGISFMSSVGSKTTNMKTSIVVLSFCSLASAGYLNGGGTADYVHSPPVQEVYEAPIHHQHVEPVHQHYEQPFVHSAPVHQHYESIQHIEPVHQHYESIQHIEPVHHHVEHVPIVHAHAAPVHEHIESIQHIEPVHHHHVDTHVQHIPEVYQAPIVHQYEAPAAYPVIHSAPQVIKIYQDVPHHHHNEVTRVLRIRYNNEKKKSLSFLQRLFS